MKNLFLAVTILVLLSGFGDQVNDPPMRQFGWLIGKWQIQSKRGLVTESWKLENDSTLTGENILTRPTGESVLLEKLQFVRRNGEYFYIPEFQGQNGNRAVSFKITAFDAKGFTAENAEHDFPKRIIYELVNTDSILAYIDNGTASPARRMDFPYSRVKN